MRFAHLSDPDEPLAVVVGDQIAPLAGSIGFATLDALIAAGPEAWAAAEAQADQVVAELGRPLAEVRLTAPLREPSKIVCIGLNYADHIRETSLDAPTKPLVFAKFPSALCGPGEPIRWPAGVTERVDWEAELAIVIGEQMRAVSVASALDGVFGYTAANDISARDVQFEDQQWTRGKTFDTFCPLGPTLVTADEFGDPAKKKLRCLVNGVVKQDSNTELMVFGPAELVSFLSHNFTLEPGDLILTGTPWGAGGFADPPHFLAAGDTVEVELEGIGPLSNPVGGPTGLSA